MKTYDLSVIGINNFCKDNSKIINDAKDAAKVDDVDTYIELVDIITNLLKESVIDLFKNNSDNDISLFVISLTEGNFSAVYTLKLYDYTEPPEEENTESKHVVVKDVSDAEKQWKGTPALPVFNRFKEELSSKDLEYFKYIINTLRQSNGGTTRVGPATINIPQKYIANAAKALANDAKSVSDNIVFLEIKFTAPSSSAKYRVYGFAVIDKAEVYLLSAYTKNSGQENANEDFDKFLADAIKYIKKLGESLLYNIKTKSYGDIKLMETFDVFDELNTILDEQAAREKLRGISDANDGKLVEDNASSDYLDGYNKTIQSLKRAKVENEKIDKVVHEFILKHGGKENIIKELNKRYDI